MFGPLLQGGRHQWGENMSPDALSLTKRHTPIDRKPTLPSWESKSKNRRQPCILATHHHKLPRRVMPIVTNAINRLLSDPPPVLRSHSYMTNTDASKIAEDAILSTFDVPGAQRTMESLRFTQRVRPLPQQQAWAPQPSPLRACPPWRHQREQPRPHRCRTRSRE